MSKYIDLENFEEKFEKMIDSIPASVDSGAGYVIDEVYKIIDSLRQERPNKYETALEKAREWMPNVNQGGHAILIDIFPELGEGLDPRYGGRKQEQTDDEDIDKVAEDLYEHLYELKRRNNVPTNLYEKQEIIDLWKAGIEYAYNHPKQEHTEQDFEKEWEEFEDWIKSYDQSDYPTCYEPKQIARHFAKWGAINLNVKKDD